MANILHASQDPDDMSTIVAGDNAASVVRNSSLTRPTMNKLSSVDVNGSTMPSNLPLYHTLMERERTILELRQSLQAMQRRTALLQKMTSSEVNAPAGVRMAMAQSAEHFT